MDSFIRNFIFSVKITLKSSFTLNSSRAVRFARKDERTWSARPTDGRRASRSVLRAL